MDTTPRSPNVMTTRRAPISWNANAWRTGSDSPRISSASSVFGTKISVSGRTTRSRFDVIAGPRRGHVQEGQRTRGPGPAKSLGEGFGVQFGQDQEIADVEHAGRTCKHGVEVVGNEPPIGPHGVDEAAILTPDVDDQGLAGRLRGIRLDAPNNRRRGGGASRWRTVRRCRRRPWHRSWRGRPAWRGRRPCWPPRRRCSGSGR